MSANFWFATAKLLHFFELRKNNTKKSPFISENTNGDKKKSVLLTSFGKFLDFRHYDCKVTTFFELPKKNLSKSKLLFVFSCCCAFFLLPLQRIHQYK